MLSIYKFIFVNNRPFRALNAQRDFNYYYHSLIFCSPPNLPPYQVDIDKFQAKHILYNPEGSEDPTSIFINTRQMSKI